MSLPADLLERALDAGDTPALTELARACDETYLEWTPPGLDGAGRAARLGRQVPRCRSRGSTARSSRRGGWSPPSRFRPADHDPSVAHVGLVFTHPSRWREGIASSMLEHAEAEMVVRGFVREQLWTPKGAPAEHFYEARGWRRDGRDEWHPWVGLEMVGYARNLL